MRHNEPNALDPALRVNVKIADRDSTCIQAEDIFAEAQSDILSKRLFEVAWEEYRSQKKYVGVKHDVVIFRSLLTFSVTSSTYGHMQPVPFSAQSILICII